MIVGSTGPSISSLYARDDSWTETELNSTSFLQLEQYIILINTFVSIAIQAIISVPTSTPQPEIRCSRQRDVEYDSIAAQHKASARNLIFPTKSSRESWLNSS